MLCFFPLYLRGLEARCRNVAWFWASSGSGSLCLLNSRSTNVFIWGPGIPSQSSPSRALPEPSPYSINGSIQQFHEFCECVWSGFWRYRGLLQVDGFQKKNLEIGMSSIGKMYIVCRFLQNALSCWYGNNTATYFDLEPPTLQDYLA